MADALPYPLPAFAPAPASPLRITARLRDRLTGAVLAQAGFNHAGLNAFLRQRLGGGSKPDGALVDDPLIEGVAPYVTAPETWGSLAETLLHPSVVQALTRGQPGDEYRFDPAAHPYAHQLEAFRHLVTPEPRSLVVTSGTGSGKTECFLVPLLHDLLTNASGDGGVRAVVLYPLNALIASQQARLRRWMAPSKGRSRFGLYNGLTPEDLPAKKAGEHPEEARSRTDIRKHPPHVLVTNVSMMEYLTIRKKDRPLLDNSQGKLRWIILDEAHSYVGSAAAEVALLLRRVLMAFGVDAAQVRFVATSATIGSGTGATEGLQRFLADLAGVSLERVHVVEGHRARVELPPAEGGPALPPDALRDPALLAANPSVQAFIRAAEAAPVPLPRAAALLHPTGLEALEVIEAVAGGGTGKPLLPFRVHQFMRAVPGLWSCVNGDCAGPKPAGWPFGTVLLERADACPSCRALALEVTRCSGCGEPYLLTFQSGDALRAGPSAPEEDEFAAASDGAGAEDGADGEGADAGDAGATGGARSPSGSVERRFLASRSLAKLSCLSLNPRTGQLLDGASEGQAVPVLKRGSEDCPHCLASAKGGSAVNRPFRFGSPFLMGNAVPVALDGVPPHPRPKQALPAGGRGLLSFSDSRQGTARFAASIETGAERAYVRALLFHMAHKAARTGAEGNAEVAALDGEIMQLEQAVVASPFLATLLADKRRQRKALHRKAQAGVPWDGAAYSIGQDANVNHWIRAVWGDRDPRFKEGETALGRFLLLRELARRPRRANAVETLGLVQLRFAHIEALGPNTIPDLLRECGATLQDWQDFLYLLLDTPVRSSFALKVDDDDVRWLVPRGGLRRNIAGPDQEKGDRTDLAWPQARAGGNTSNAVIWLERRLHLDRAEGRDRAAMNEVLRDAWTQLRPLFETVGADRSLDLDKTTIAPVSRAWLCPVTRRVLTRLAFGRTPYGQRECSPMAKQLPAELAFPALPCWPEADADRDALQAWLQSDSAVAALRAHGVWTDLHDRATLLSPFLRAEEHSAQQPPHRLRRFEAAFKEGEINLLACSTTMEMGVDIGSVSAVLMTNVPPSVANYRQRAGRAGRRGQAWASSLTLARTTPLDMEAFKDPSAYLRRELLPPSVRLDSRRIVQRHANALLLARWFAQAGGEMLKMKVGAFFGLPEAPAPGSPALAEDDGPAAAFCAWLAEPSTAIAVDVSLGRLLTGTALHGQHDGARAEAREGFAKRAKELRSQWQTLRDEMDRAPSDAARKGIGFGLRRLCGETLLKELANSALLPGHGFPTAVVPFQIEADRAGTDADDEDSPRARRYDYPSRNTDAALREYAPGAEVVVDGLVWTSAGLTLNWQRPAHEGAVKEIQSLRWHWRCTHCGAADCSRIMMDACPACGEADAQRFKMQRFIEPAGFRVDAAAAPHAGTEQARFVPPRPIRASTRRADWEPLLDPALGRMRASAEGQVFHSSRGLGGEGFHVCLACGRAAEDRKALDEHAAIWCRPKEARRDGRTPGKGLRCEGNDQPFAIAGPLALGYELQTDVAELQLAALPGKGAAYALAAALREAHARRLGIDPREMAFDVDRHWGPLGQDTHSVFLSDRNAGGAGFATRLPDDLPGLLDAARRILDCANPGCIRGCPACVLVADLPDDGQRLLDRRDALACVERLAAGFAAVPEADQAALGAILSRPAADALARRVQPGTVATLFAHAPFDLGALDRQPFAAMFEAAERVGVERRVAFPPSVLAGLNAAERRGLQDAAARHGLGIMSAAPTLAPNGARLLAILQHGEAATAWWARDEVAARFDAGWGTGAQCPVVEAPLPAPPPCSPVPQAALEPAPRSSVLQISKAGPWTFNRFGHELGKLLRPRLESIGMWRPGELAMLSYADRYLHSPLAAGLALHALAWLAGELGSKGGRIPLRLQTALKADADKPPYALPHDWLRSGSRDAVAFALARLLRLDPTLDATGAGHARVVTLSFGKEACCIYLDQGFGYWRIVGKAGFDFSASPDKQAAALAACTVAVSGTGHSYLAFARAGADG